MHSAYSNSDGDSVEGNSFTPKLEFQDFSNFEIHIPDYAFPKFSNKEIECYVAIRREINGEWKTIESKSKTVIIDNQNPNYTTDTVAW